MALAASQRNNMIMQYLGNTSYSVPTTIYLGISTTPINPDGTGATEPIPSTGYTRVALSNSTNTWNTASNGIVSNKERIEFPELVIDAGTAVSYFLAHGPTSNPIWMDSFTSPRVLGQYTILYVLPGEAQFGISNSQSI